MDSSEISVTAESLENILARVNGVSEVNGENSNIADVVVMLKWAEISRRHCADGKFKTYSYNAGGVPTTASETKRHRTIRTEA